MTDNFIVHQSIVNTAVHDDRYNFDECLDKHGLHLLPASIETLQINITKLCNQACRHCHVDASPKRTEMMSDAIIDTILEILATHPTVRTLDITGGAPELHPRFRDIVRQATSLGKHIMVRHNLTVTLDGNPVTGEDMHYLPTFFADHGVEVICSLPYYQEYFTDKQRGKGVFDKSIESLLLLNRAGYAQETSSLVLNVVYNPAGAFLPASQLSLENDFKKELWEKYGIRFSHLFTMTNMPIHRFKETLVRHGGYEEYMEKLVNAFNPTAAKGIMCRSLLSVSYDGILYDCDFNQMLELPITAEKKTIGDFSFEALLQRNIAFASHCFGCTAGAGSSCGGATAV